VVGGPAGKMPVPVYGKALQLDPTPPPDKRRRRRGGVKQEWPGHYDGRVRTETPAAHPGTFAAWVHRPGWKNGDRTDGDRTDGYFVTARPTEEGARYARRRVTLQLHGEPLVLPRTAAWRVLDYEAGVRMPEADYYDWALLEQRMLEALASLLRRLGTAPGVLEQLLRGGFRPEELNRAAGRQLVRFWRRDGRGD
jgi:hypothetical protein